MEMRPANIADRHVSTQQAFKWLEFEHLPSGSPQRIVSSMFHDLATNLLYSLGDGPEFTLCLRSLSQAKDYAVHQAVEDSRTDAANE